VDDAAGALEILSPEQLRLTQELLRRAVFIELEVGRSRHRELSTLRWHFRRIYLPTFKAGLWKNDALKVAGESFKAFLDAPEKELEAALSKRTRVAKETSHPILDGFEEGA
jgi:hypothetical protein